MSSQMHKVFTWSRGSASCHHLLAAFSCPSRGQEKLQEHASSDQVVGTSCITYKYLTPSYTIPDTARNRVSQSDRAHMEKVKAVQLNVKYQQQSLFKYFKKNTSGCVLTTLCVEEVESIKNISLIYHSDLSQKT